MKNITARKNIRLKEYDYSQAGYYFITICTKNKECILTNIKNSKNDAMPVGVAPPGRPTKYIITNR